MLKRSGVLIGDVASAAMPQCIVLLSFWKSGFVVLPTFSRRSL